MTSMAIRGLVAVLALSGAAHAQAPDPAPPPRVVVASEPTSTLVAMSGIVVVAAGFGMMLHQSCTPVCGSDPGWLVGGVAVIGAGVTLVYLGLRTQTVIVAPSLGPRLIGATATVRWGRGKRKESP